MVIAVIQARMGSTRLPGKSLMKIEGKSLIWHVIHRVKQSKYVNKVILATSEKPQNEPLIKEALKAGAEVFAGSENDVLDRFYNAVKKFGAKDSDILVRINGDCPLIDPEIIDNNIKVFINEKVDYVNSGVSYPDGMGDCEVFSFKSLELAWKNTVGADREHVTPYFWKNPNIFQVRLNENTEDLSNYVFSVDHEVQLEAVKQIYAHLYNRLANDNTEVFHMRDVIDFVNKNTEVLDMVKDIDRSCPTQHVKDQNKKKYAKSLALLKRAKEVTPCASQTYSKSYRYYCEGSAPAFMDCGKGSHVWDVDGNEFIDFVGALGAITVGYCNDEVDEAVINQLKKGISFSQSTALEVELAEKLIQIIPSAEMVRFVKNGSDATAAAIRLARAHTGKDIIAVCGYHGYQDWYIGSTENDRGVPEISKSLIKKFDYNNIESLNNLFLEYKDKIAGVILEPIQVSGPKDGFLEKVKEITHRNGALLIFDEVVTGFRVHISGAQGMYDVIPDLTALGKGMGNGLPISAIVGKKELLRLIEEGTFISTTHGGETLSLAGSLATIKILERPESFKHMWKMGEKLRRNLNQIILNKGLGDVIEIKGLDIQILPVFKSTGKLSSYDLLSVYQQTMLEEGILVLTFHNLCVAHSDKDIDAYLRASERALSVVKIAVEKDSIQDVLTGGKFNPIFKRVKTH